MNVYSIAEEIRTACQTITGLRTPPWGASQIQAPAAVVALPEEIRFDATYVRGLDEIRDWPLAVLVGAPEERASIKNLAAYADGSGAKSIKSHLEAYPWTTCGSLVVERVEFDGQATYAGTPYLAALFHLHIFGPGA